MDIEIRPGRRSDAPAISAFLVPLAEKFIAHEFDPTPRHKFLATFSPAAIDQYLGSGFRYHPAESQGSLVGVVSIKNESHVYHLFVAESAQRTGLGRRLWQIARQASLAASHRGDFTVNSSRFAVGFYVQLGFERNGPENNQDGVVSIPMRLRWRAANKALQLTSAELGAP